MDKLLALLRHADGPLLLNTGIPAILSLWIAAAHGPGPFSEHILAVSVTGRI
jgi:hypothetical protein